MTVLLCASRNFMVFVIPRPSKVISQRLAPSYPWYPSGPGPVGAIPFRSHPLAPLCPRTPAGQDLGGKDPGHRPLPPEAGGCLGPFASLPPPPPKSPLRPNLQTLLAGPQGPPPPPRTHSAQQPPALFPGPARSRPPPLATGEPRRESRSALRPIPDPQALWSTCGPPLCRLSSQPSSDPYRFCCLLCLRNPEFPNLSAASSCDPRHLAYGLWGLRRSRCHRLLRPAARSPLSVVRPGTGGQSSALAGSDSPDPPAGSRGLRSAAREPPWSHGAEASGGSARLGLHRRRAALWQMPPWPRRT